MSFQLEFSLTINEYGTRIYLNDVKLSQKKGKRNETKWRGALSSGLRKTRDPPRHHSSSSLYRCSLSLWGHRRRLASTADRHLSPARERDDRSPKTGQPQPKLHHPTSPKSHSQKSTQTRVHHKETGHPCAEIRRPTPPSVPSINWRPNLSQKPPKTPHLRGITPGFCKNAAGIREQAD